MIYQGIEQMVNEGVKGIEALTKVSDVDVLWKTLVEERKKAVRCTDKEGRNRYVNIQRVFEASLAGFLKEGKIDRLLMISCTPRRPTPLINDGTTTNCIGQHVLGDPVGLDTVTKRVNTTRDMLANGATIMAVSPLLAVDKVEAKGKQIYEGLQARYTGQGTGKLIDQLIDAREIPEEKSGATYLFEIEGKVFAVALKSYQVDDTKVQPDDLREWCAWVGEARDPVVSERIREMDMYLRDQGIQMWEEFENSAQPIVGVKETKKARGAALTPNTANPKQIETGKPKNGWDLLAF
jgi:hypothetical protein